MSDTLDETSSSSSTSSNFYDEKEHNMWNPLLELFFHMQIGQCMASLVDEVSTARIALSCHFALDILCDKEGGAFRFDSLSSDGMSPDLGEMWRHGHTVSPVWEGDLELHSADEDGSKETTENENNNTSDGNEVEDDVGSGNENEDESLEDHSTYTCSPPLTSRDPDEYNDHNMKNPALGLFNQKEIGVVMKMIIDEVPAERIAVSCHFSLDVVTNQKSKEGDGND